MEGGGQNKLITKTRQTSCAQKHNSVIRTDLFNFLHILCSDTSPRGWSEVTCNALLAPDTVAVLCSLLQWRI